MMQKLAAYIRQALSSSFDNSEVICFPTMWIANPGNTKTKGDDASDIALQFYKMKGLVGDRGDMSGYGYAAILRELLFSSPWVEHDCFTDTEQKVKHRPFLLDAIETSIARHRACANAVPVALGTDRGLRALALQCLEGRGRRGGSCWEPPQSL